MSPELHDHPLAGQVWRTRDNVLLDPGQLVSELQGASYLLLGEKHDNPDHHQLRQWLLTAIHQEHPLLKVSLEMLDSGQQRALDDVAVRPTPLRANALREQIAWDEQGWPWKFYGPLLMDLVNWRVTIRAANISRAEVSQVYGGKMPAGAGAVLDSAKHELLERDIDKSHCGMLPESQFGAMVRVQQARDFQMATSLLAGDPAVDHEEGLRVLVAGNYHIRRDVGVPRYLAALEPGAAVVTLAWLEVSADSDEPAQIVAQQYAPGVFDYVWFTPAVATRDYCADFSR